MSTSARGSPPPEPSAPGLWRSCPSYNTSYHPCTYPYLTLPNATPALACASTYADAYASAYDAARALFFIIGTPVFGRYIYLMWYICRHHGGDCRSFEATDNMAVCGFICMAAWLVRTIDVFGARGILPFSFDGMLIAFCQTLMITFFVCFVPSWLATLSITQGQPQEEREAAVKRSVTFARVTMVLLWVVQFLLFAPMQYWLLDADVAALGGVYNGSVFAVVQLLVDLILISYCSMALYSGLKILRSLEGLGASNTGAEKAKRTILSYMLAAFVGSLITVCAHSVSTSSRLGTTVVASPPCSASDAYVLSFSHWIIWLVALFSSAAIRSRHPGGPRWWLRRGAEDNGVEASTDSRNSGGSTSKQSGSSASSGQQQQQQQQQPSGGSPPEGRILSKGKSWNHVPNPLNDGDDGGDKL